MRTEEMIEKISKEAKDNVRFEELKMGVPLGINAAGEIVLAQKRLKPVTVRNTCVTGANKTQFIRRLLITLSCINIADEACFIVLSPNAEYGELLRLGSVDFTVPYIRTKADVAQAMATLKELLYMRETGGGYPHIFLVLDGLESLTDCNKNSDLEEYSAILDLFMRRTDVDVICGVDLGRSIFAGCPGTFLGKGNCLVTARESGKADVTYVNEDASLTLPMPITYANEPTVMESIIYLNALPVNG
jgi:hypothetical protein